MGFLLIMKKTVTLKLNGNVVLSDFATVISHLASLIEELTSEVGENAEIEWEISKLESGSATAVMVGKSLNEFAVDNVVHAYEVIWEAVSEDKPIPFNETISREARSITHVINGRINSIEMRTDDYQTTIQKSSIEEDQEEKKDYSLGTVTGWVETLSKHGRMRFVLYDVIFDKAVVCYLAKNQENLMLDAWDNKISVAGKVYRDFKTGRPYQVLDVNYIEKKEDSPPGSFMQAQGVVPWREGDRKPEEIIREYRDAQ
ncbi:MAG: hypothetical protein PWQ55_2685 [Chloroflexota bacterium]|nr:hypothetical protein [Chloroflexota bacterium]